MLIRASTDAGEPALIGEKLSLGGLDAPAGEAPPLDAASSFSAALRARAASRLRHAVSRSCFPQAESGFLTRV